MAHDTTSPIELGLEHAPLIEILADIIAAERATAPAEEVA